MRASKKQGKGKGINYKTKSYKFLLPCAYLTCLRFVHIKKTNSPIKSPFYFRIKVIVKINKCQGRGEKIYQREVFKEYLQIKKAHHPSVLDHLVNLPIENHYKAKNGHIPLPLSTFRPI